MKKDSGDNPSLLRQLTSTHRARIMQSGCMQCNDHRPATQGCRCWSPEHSVSLPLPELGDNSTRTSMASSGSARLTHSQDIHCGGYAALDSGRRRSTRKQWRCNSGGGGFKEQSSGLGLPTSAGKGMMAWCRAARPRLLQSSIPP